ncbi:HlyD family secretion protein [Epilithonimonas vandammei]|uniref:HlyD family secretion protein n=2 Tax=Epilithonimonas TaxID=2782229 RepID=UPI0028AB3723|nr:HlyD family secretion protein [Epilithonimonas vandammei]
MENKKQNTPETKSAPVQSAVALKKKENKKNKVRAIISNIIVFIVIGVGLFYLIREYYHLGDKTYTEDAQVEEFINPINTRVSAYIKEIKFIEHQKVKKGDTLLVLDNREILTQLGQAEAAYQNAIAQKMTAGSSVVTVSNNTNVVQSNIAGSKARLWNAEQNLNRYKNLLAAEAVTQQQYDQVKTEYDAQKAAYETLLNQKNTANLSTIEAKNRLGINDAEIKRTKSALDMARINLSYTVITAPYDGVMGRRTISEGQLIQPGQQVATIVLNGQKWVTANFLESQMPNIKIGEKMIMAADALGGQKFEGKVTAISAATGAKYSSVPTDNSTGNFIKVQQRIPVRIEFTSNNKKEDIDKLSAGMNMNIKLESNK